jgi:hypothetical protein
LGDLPDAAFDFADDFVVAGVGSGFGVVLAGASLVVGVVGLLVVVGGLAGEGVSLLAARGRCALGAGVAFGVGDDLLEVSGERGGACAYTGSEASTLTKTIAPAKWRHERPRA